MEFGLDEVIEAVPQFQRQSGPAWVQAFADYYLGQAHRDDLAGGCAMTTPMPAKPCCLKLRTARLR